MEDWANSEFAGKWDASTTQHNPARVEQLDILLAVLKDEYRQGKTILDVGIGSGQVEEQIFSLIPYAQVVGIDSSQPMVELANDRLAAYKGQYSVVMHDLTQTASLVLPTRGYQVAISVQVIHNVADDYKKQIFGFIYNVLEDGGLFLLLDRISIDTPDLFSCYKSVWARLDRVHNARMAEGDTFEQHTKTVSTRGDQPATLEQHLQWLREAGFQPACLHLHANRALFAARKMRLST